MGWRASVVYVQDGQRFRCAWVLVEALYLSSLSHGILLWMINYMVLLYGEIRSECQATQLQWQHSFLTPVCKLGLFEKSMWNWTTECALFFYQRLGKKSPAGSRGSGSMCIEGVHSFRGRRGRKREVSRLIFNFNLGHRQNQLAACWKCVAAFLPLLVPVFPLLSEDSFQWPSSVQVCLHSVDWPRWVFTSPSPYSYSSSCHYQTFGPESKMQNHCIFLSVRFYLLSILEFKDRVLFVFPQHLSQCIILKRENMFVGDTQISSDCSSSWQCPWSTASSCLIEKSFEVW